DKTKSGRDDGFSVVVNIVRDIHGGGGAAAQSLEHGEASHGRALFRAQRRKRNPPFTSERRPVRGALILGDPTGKDSNEVRVTGGEAGHDRLSPPNGRLP